MQGEPELAAVLLQQGQAGDHAKAESLAQTAAEQCYEGQQSFFLGAVSTVTKSLPHRNPCLAVASTMAWKGPGGHKPEERCLLFWQEAHLVAWTKRQRVCLLHTSEGTCLQLFWEGHLMVWTKHCHECVLQKPEVVATLQLHYGKVCLVVWTIH